MLKNFLFQFKKVNDRFSSNLLPYTLKNLGLGLVGTSSNTTSFIALKVSPLFFLNSLQKLELVWSCLRETKWPKNKAQRNPENYGMINKLVVTILGFLPCNKPVVYYFVIYFFIFIHSCKKANHEVQN